VGIGIALGVGAFIGSTLLNSKIAQVVLQLEEPSPLLWPLLDPHLTAPLVVAPALSYLAGRLIEGPRWTIVTTTIIVLQGSLALVLALTVHPEVVVNPGELGITVVAGGIGLALSGWAMGLGRHRNPQQAPLAAVGDGPVKASAPPASPAAPPPTSGTAPVAPARSPAAEPTPPSSDEDERKP